MYLETSADGIEFFVQYEDSDHSSVKMSVPNFGLSDLMFTYNFSNEIVERDYKESELKEWDEFIEDIESFCPVLYDRIKKAIKKCEGDNGDKKC